MRHAGELAALGTAMCWATGSNFFAAAGRRLGSTVLNRLRITVALVLLSATLLVTRGSPLPTWATPVQVAWLGLSGLIGFIFADAHFFRALVILGPGRATLLASLAPVFTILMAWPILGERPAALALGGTALTLGGIVWVIQASGRHEHAQSEGSVAGGVMSGVLAALGQAVGYVLTKSACAPGSIRFRRRWCACSRRCSGSG